MAETNTLQMFFLILAKVLCNDLQASLETARVRIGGFLNVSLHVDVYNVLDIFISTGPLDASRNPNGKKTFTVCMHDVYNTTCVLFVYLNYFW